MQNTLTDSNKIIEALHKLDIHCKRQNTFAELIIVGGAAIFLSLDMVGAEFRPTLDIDVSILSFSNLEKLRELLSQHGIDIVDGVLELPPLEDFKLEGNRYLINANFTNLRIYVPTLELLACSKIFSTRGKDLKDLQESELLDHCDIHKLNALLEDYKTFALFMDNKDLNFHSLECILKEKGIY